jgi:hypothetical protein
MSAVMRLQFAMNAKALSDVGGAREPTLRATSLRQSTTPGRASPNGAP